MCVVRSRATVPGITAERVRAVLADGTALAEACDQVVEVSGTPQEDQRWRVLLNGSEVTWVQRAGTALDFTQVEGDLAELRGAWAVEPDRLGLMIEFHLGIDGLAPLLDPIWTQSFQAFADALVVSVAQLGETR
jgi:hypothetical protein